MQASFHSKWMISALGIIASLYLLALPAPAQSAPPAPPHNPLPRIVQKDGRFALFVNDAPYLILGAQINNSSAWPAMMPKVWPALDSLHVNTVEMPVYWEQLEPKPGQFDFSVVDALVGQAREHNVHLVFLWFGTWKNGSNHYMPAWMKLDPQKYPNIVGSDGQPIDSPSPHSQATLDEDIRAFTALMGHLKAADPQHTVIMMQVENEPGTWGGIRDYSPTAQKLFDGPVPPALLAALGPERKIQATSQPTNWRAVFGDDADEYFHAWSVAHFIGEVAAAGKAVYHLPMYVNASLRDPLNPGRAGTYETGGATNNVLWIWKVAAPALDMLCPDIYQRDSAHYLAVLDQYATADNPLFVPESIGGPDAARYFFAVLGHGGIGFAPFGVDNTRAEDDAAAQATAETYAALSADYQALGPMSSEIASLNFQGLVQTRIEDDDPSQLTMHFNSWDVTTAFGAAASRRGGGGGGRRGAGSRPTGSLTGRVLVAQLNPGEFIITGFSCRVNFIPTGPGETRTWQYLKVEEGQYQNGTFVPTRIWNGDQTDFGLAFGSTPTVLHVMLYVR